MCKASHRAINTRDAQPGDKTQLGLSQDELPQFQRERDVGRAAGLLTCPMSGQTMNLSKIPLEVQNSMQIPAEITAIFIETEDDEVDSLFYQGRELDLWRIADEARKSGVPVEVLMLNEISDAELVRILNIMDEQAATPAQIAAARAMPVSSSVQQVTQMQEVAA